ncbi:MAG: sugar ABC transporter permease, partial [Thaumarchaeota archaeon]
MKVASTKAHKKKRPELTGYYMVLPATLLVGLFTIYPFAEAIYLSFVKYITYKPDEIGVFVGLGNFIGAIQESFFAESVLNTLWFTGISVLVITLAGLGVAMVLSQKFKGASLVTSIMLVSW